MKYRLFIKEQNGDFNFDKLFTSERLRNEALSKIIKSKRYWVDDKTIIPWHRVEYVRFETVEEG